VERVPGRLEQLECGQSFGVLSIQPARQNSRLHAPDASQNTAGRLICVFGAPGGRNKKSRAELGRVAERSCDLPIITSNDPRHESHKIAHDILDSFLPAKGTCCRGGRGDRYRLLTAQPGRLRGDTGKGTARSRLWASGD
jgi:UDP-N-acetylmuramyl tripeptide synthase